MLHSKFAFPVCCSLFDAPEDDVGSSAEGTSPPEVAIFNIPVCSVDSCGLRHGDLETSAALGVGFFI